MSFVTTEKTMALTAKQRYADVIIVGAGAVGLLTALKLGRAGVDTILLEAYSELLQAPRAIAYMPVVSRELRKLGVFDKLKAIGLLNTTGLTWRRKEGEALGTLPTRGAQDQTLTLGQDSLGGAILNTIKEECPSVKIIFSQRCVGIAQEDGKVTVLTSSDHEDYFFHAKFVVGCDGANSAVRRMSMIPFEGFTWKNFRFTAADVEPVSPSRRGMAPESYPRASFRRGSPVQEGRPLGNTLKRRSPSVSRSAPSAQNSAPGSHSPSRRSSPSSHPDRTPIGPRGRSPANEPMSHQRLPSTRDTSASYHERKHLASSEVSPHNGRWHDERATLSGRRELDPSSRVLPRSSVDQQAGDSMNGIPSQPRSYSNQQRHLPLPGNSHGPSSSSSDRRGSNLSLLSAPTGPRGSGYRDHPPAGTPSRRAHTPAVIHAPPLGPRAHPGQGAPGNEAHPHSGLRQGTATPTLDSPRTQKPTNHLAGLGPVIPGGKLIPSPLDVATTKRLSQLQADRERLFEQAAGTQKLKRLVAMDWDKLDRESSISDLKSELADGHLQYITEGDGIHAGVTF